MFKKPTLITYYGSVTQFDEVKFQEITNMVLKQKYTSIHI